VAAAPALLEAHVSQALQSVASSLSLQIIDRHTESFRPGQHIWLAPLNAAIQT